MALNGTINGAVTNLSSHFSFYVEWSGTQDIAQNCTWITATSYWSTDNTSYAFDTVSKRDASITINGTATAISQRFDCNPWNSSGIFQIQQVSLFRVDHNADGTKQITISARANGYASSYGPSSSSSASGDCTASATITLDTIPRYATISQSLSSKTETSIAINWSTDAIVDKLWYSKNDGSSWTAVTISESQSGTFSITGLTAGTTYKVKTRVRRKDSQLTSDSSALSVTTYAYPYATSMPNFSIGNSVTIEIYNPLSRSVTVTMTDSNGNAFASMTGTGTGFIGFNSASAVNAMYASIPNAKYGTYRINVTYSGNTSITTGGRYTVKESVCSPIIGALTYQDTKSSVIAITGNNQDIVQNHSTVRFTATGLSAQKSATLVSCSVECNGQTLPMSFLSGNASARTPSGSEQTIDSGSNVTATFTLTDSRGISSTATVSVHMLAWTNPSAIITIERHNNFYSETDILCDAQYPSINGNNRITITYSCKKDGDSSPSVTGSLSDNVVSTVTLDNNYGWTISITLTDSLGGTTTYTTKVSRGMPIIFFDRLRNSVSVEKFPEYDNSFEVSGLSLLSDDIHPSDTISTASVTLPSQSGHIVRLNYNGAITATIPADLPIGYECILVNIYQGARVTLVTSGSESISIVGMTATVTSFRVPVSYACFRLIKVTSSRWYLEGVSKHDCYTAGDTITGANVRGAFGWVTTSQTACQLIIPLSKPLLDVSGATLNSISGGIRSCFGGYIQYYDGTTYTAVSSGAMTFDSSAVQIYGDQLSVILYCTHKWGLGSQPITNNSLVSGLITALSITLS